MQIEIKAGQLADLELLLEFSRRLYEEDPSATGDVPFEAAAVRQALAELLNDPRWGQAWLVYAEGDPIGYIVLTMGFSLEYHGRDAFIDELYLLPAWQGRGVGRRVLEFIEAKAANLGVNALHLEVERRNTRAQFLYQNFGFRDQQRLLMSKWIR